MKVSHDNLIFGDPNIRFPAGFSLLVLHFLDCFAGVAEFGVHLAELTVDPQGALAIRQVRLNKPTYQERVVRNHPNVNLKKIFDSLRRA